MIEIEQDQHVDSQHIATQDPRLATLAVLDQGLTPSRRKIANEILFQLNSKHNPSLRHHTLLVGPVGSGKSHIMKYLQTILDHFQESTVVIVIHEETRSILSLFDFIVTCLRYYDAVSSDQLVATLQSTDPDPVTALIRLFDEHTADRKTAIFIEDFSDLFRNMSNADRDAMRSFFNERRHITVVASSLSMIVEKRTALGTLADLFSVRRLPELSADETSMFLARMLMNQKHLPPMQTSAMLVLHHIAGGNQLLMEKSGRMMNAREWPELSLVIPDIIDEVFAPYFERRLRVLNESQRFVLEAIARHNGEALSEDRLAELIDMPREELTAAIEELKLALYIDQIRVGQISYFDIHEPFIRIFMEHGMSAHDEFRTLVTLTTRWLEVERRREVEWALTPATNEETLRQATQCAESLELNEAVRQFSAILENDPLNPTAVAQLFKIHLSRSRFDALSFLENVLATRSRSLKDPLQLIEAINKLTVPDLELQSQLIAIWAGPNQAVAPSIIHAFIENRDDNESYIRETLVPLISELAQESPVMRMLHELVQGYLDRETVPNHPLLHIPVELRTLLTKHAKMPDQLYIR